MGLKESIRKHRQRDKTPGVFEPDTFTRIAAILEAFDLSAVTFMKVLDEESPSRTVDRALAREGPRKTPVPIPPFALVDPESYAVVESLRSRLQCPYLPWAETPEDLFLCRALYALHPNIPPEQLKRYTFAYLYRFYAAKKRTPEASHG